ncbi:MAG: ATP-dependent sacrificial sulfur transferase LarE [Gammaproteobacteria bacterium]|nr:ATP-dependent sacrificial sulfur transferase LarE [Gammaproteobacteria bacterium]
MRPLQELIAEIENWYSQIDKAAIALSGGIDSSLVAFTARKMLGKDKVVAVISASASVKMKELKDARNFTQQYDITLQEIDAREIDNPDYANNPQNRCFFCKSALYNALDTLIADTFSGFTVLNGNNFSDFGDYRPGLEAAAEHQVRSPLAECQFSKQDIRRVAQHYGLPNWNKPASPCLSSRFPYGENITVEKLKRVEQAEDLLNTFGFEDVRVRYIKDAARIEVPAPELDALKKSFNEIRPQIEAMGFAVCEIDEEGLVSGKLNRGIVSAPTIVLSKTPG